MPILTESQTPLALVRKWSTRAPGCYEALDGLRDYWLTSGATTTHPACDIPISAAATYLVSVCGETQNEMALDASELTACYSWRKNKIIYAFDLDLARELSDQALEYTPEDDLPVEVLLHPPYPCVYFHLPQFFPLKSPVFLRGLSGMSTALFRSSVPASFRSR
jgi:hypothetical protein